MAFANDQSGGTVLRRILILSVVGALASAACGSTPTDVATSASATAADSARESYLKHEPKCSGLINEGDFGAHAGRAPDPSGPTSPEEALDRFSASMYPAVARNSFVAAADDRRAAAPSDRAVKFAYTDASGDELLVLTELRGDRWYVTGTKVCEDLRVRVKSK